MSQEQLQDSNTGWDNIYKEEATVGYVSAFVTASRLYWRSLGGRDIGIEKQAENEELGGPRGMALVQIKGTNPGKVKTSKTLPIPASQRNYFYWSHERLPVIISVVVVKKHPQGTYYCSKCYWIDFTNFPIEHIKERHIANRTPKREPPWETARQKAEQMLVNATQMLAHVKDQRQSRYQSLTPPLLNHLPRRHGVVLHVREALAFRHRFPAHFLALGVDFVLGVHEKPVRLVVHVVA